MIYFINFPFSMSSSFELLRNKYPDKPIYRFKNEITNNDYCDPDCIEPYDGKFGDHRNFYYYEGSNLVKVEEATHVINADAEIPKFYTYD